MMHPQPAEVSVSGASFHNNHCGRLLHAHVLRSQARGSFSVVDADDETHARLQLDKFGDESVELQRRREPTGEETGHTCHPSLWPSFAAADVAVRQEIEEPPFLDLAQIDFVATQRGTDLQTNGAAIRFWITQKAVRDFVLVYPARSIFRRIQFVTLCESTPNAVAKRPCGVAVEVLPDSPTLKLQMNPVDGSLKTLLLSACAG